MTEKTFDDGDLTRELSEIPESIYDNGEPVVTRSYTPKQISPEVSEKTLNRRVLWTVLSLLVTGLVVLASFLAFNASR